MTFILETILLVLLGMFLPLTTPMLYKRTDENAIIRVENTLISKRIRDAKQRQEKPQEIGDLVYVPPSRRKDIINEIYSKVKTNSRLYQILTSRNVSCAFVYLRAEAVNGSKRTLQPEEHFQDVRIQVVNEFLDTEEDSFPDTKNDTSRYDHKGAMYFAVAVITIYGLSITLLIASTVRRSGVDYELKGFIRSFAKLRIDRVTPPREKFKVGRALLDSGALLRLTAQGHILPRKQLVMLFPNEAVTSSSSKLSAVTSSSAGNSCFTSGHNSGQESSECSIESAREETVQSENMDYNDCFGQIEVKEEYSSFRENRDILSSREERSDGTVVIIPPGPRHVKIYQGKERGKIDVRSMDIALDIPEYSAI